MTIRPGVLHRGLSRWRSADESLVSGQRAVEESAAAAPGEERGGQLELRSRPPEVVPARVLPPRGLVPHGGLDLLAQRLPAGRLATHAFVEIREHGVVPDLLVVLGEPVDHVLARGGLLHLAGELAETMVRDLLEIPRLAGDLEAEPGEVL